MPVLPSGRRIEFSLDRFHTLLAQLDRRHAQHIAAALREPDDLLPVLDAVHFSREDGTPYFADYFAADWTAYAAEWSSADRQAMRDWLVSDEARFHRAQAIAYIRTLLLDMREQTTPYPYVMLDGMPVAPAHAGLALRH